ncbi:hypothetical protein QBC34DRAFT_475108 [Podospora aff. communis PSN243]|uniref:Uncharacterized protein n=1 Tax=Podospora aff. communis PSN243 TaxID=3040156 RepID=A0AAV9G6F7_9PEZI|nr:hypothetical protein QBC34DRAFT_475108 [Podospora aff. communis PSN243]
MKFLTVVALLAGIATALPGPVPEPDSMDPLDKRSCVNCVTYCCSQAGGCNFLNCAGSRCITNAAGYSYCQCNCRYG